MGAMGGAMAANQERVAQQELAVKEGELGFKMQELDERRAKARQDMIEKTVTTQFEIFKNISQGVLALGQEGKFERGGAIDKAFNQVIDATAKAAEMIGVPKDTIYAQADALREQAINIRKQQVLSPGQQIMQIDPATGQMRSIGAVPPNPQNVAPGGALVQAVPGQAGQPTTVQKIYEQPPNPNANVERFGSPQLIFDKDGNQVGSRILGDKSGAWTYRDLENNVVQPKPDWRVDTQSSQRSGQLSAGQSLDLQREVLMDGQSIDTLTGLVRSRQDAPTGWRLVANRWVGEWKTVFNEKLKDPQFKAMIQEGKLAQALGGLRVPLLGPGVMTQQDKEFLVTGVGGDVNAFSNPQVMAGLLKDLVERKIALYNLNREVLATQAERFPALKIKVPPAKEIDKSIFGKVDEDAAERAGSQPARPAPTPGTVRNGYRFKGGDPGEQANWEKVE